MKRNSSFIVLVIVLAIALDCLLISRVDCALSKVKKTTPKSKLKPSVKDAEGQLLHANPNFDHNESGRIRNNTKMFKAFFASFTVIFNVFKSHQNGQKTHIHSHLNMKYIFLKFKYLYKRLFATMGNLN
jgi:hypothetical protein